MTPAAIQAKIYAGYAKAASIIGLTFSVYRPNTVANSTPLASGNLVASLPAQMTVNSSGANFNKPGGDEDYFWQCMADGRLLKVGDYLVNATAGTFFITAMQPLLPLLAVKCNNVISIKRAIANQFDSIGSVSVGAQPYSGVENSTNPLNPNGEQTLFASVPIALVSRAIGKAKGLDITPSDAPGPVQWWAYPSPAAVPQGSVRDRDVLVDQDSYRYQTAGAYWTANGYRLQTIRVEA